MRSFLSALAGLGLLAVTVPASAGLLYGIDHQADTLITVDTSSFVTTTIGPLGTNTQNAGLAYDPNSDTLFMSAGTANTNLYSVDRNTGAASIVGNHGANALLGLAFDSLNNVLYGSSLDFTSQAQLVTIDPLTGTSTNVVSTTSPTSRIFGLAYDSSNDRLVGTNFNVDSNSGLRGLNEIDRTTGTETLLAGFGTIIDGFTYDPDLDLFWGSPISPANTLITFDPNNGFASNSINVPGLGSTVGGLTYVSTAATPVSEPSTLAALGIGLLTIGTIARRRRKV